MTADRARWARLKELFTELSESPEPRRSARLAEVETADPALAAELRALLESDQETSDDAGNAEAAGAAAPPMLQISTELRAAFADAASRAAGDALEPAADQPLPARIGEYRVYRLLGEGGMGIVYLAEQEHPRRHVAIKVMHSAAAGRALLRRFRREVELLGRLQHPNIALIYGTGIAPLTDESGTMLSEPRPFFAMEFVHGETITEHARRHGLTVVARVELLIKVCDAVEHAHRRGVIHRDLKPANILVDERGEPKVLDFGIARPTADDASTLRTAVGEVVGTLPYMSPEQVSGLPESVDGRSDVYALGVILYELLSGRRPLDVAGRTVAEAARIVSEDEPSRLSIIDRSLRGDLDTIAAKCLEKNPARRYQSAAELRDDLRRHLRDLPIDARPPSTFYTLSKLARRHRQLMIGAIVSITILVAGTIVAVVFALREHAAKLEAKERLRIAQVENSRSTYSFGFLRELLLSVKKGRDTPVGDFLDMSRRIVHRSGQSTQLKGLIGHLIGVSYWRLGEFDAAEEELRACIEPLRILDPSDVDADYATDAQLALHDVLRAQGKLEETMPILQEVLARRRDLMGRAVAKGGPPADTGCVAALLRIAMYELAHGRVLEADRAAREAMAQEEILSKTGAADEERMAMTQHAVAAVLLAQDKPAEAEPLLRRAVQPGAKVRLPATGAALLSLAEAELALGNPAEAATAAERAVATFDACSMGSRWEGLYAKALAMSLREDADQAALASQCRELDELLGERFGAESAMHARMLAVLAAARRGVEANDGSK